MIQATFNNIKVYVYLFILLTIVSTAFMAVTFEANAANFMPPTLGDYPNAAVQLSGNITIAPTTPLNNAVSVTGTASPDFKGQISVDITSGVVQVTNAYPAGSYTVTISAFDSNGATTIKTFNLAVQTSAACNQTDFKQAPTFSVAANPQKVQVGDFNGDSKDDLVVISNTSNSISILRSTSVAGTSTFAPAINFMTASIPQSIAVGDFDGDGKQDIATSNFPSNSLSIFINTSTNPSSISFATAVDVTVDSYFRNLVTGDVDGDGKQDLIGASGNSNSVSVFKNVSTGVGAIAFDSGINYVVGSNPSSVAVGDLDADGKLDIATSNRSSENISVLRNTRTNIGTISFAPKVDFAVGSGFGSNSVSLVIADLDGDSKSDIAVANLLSNGVSVLRNTSSGSGIINFAPRINFGIGLGGYSIIAKDFDHDGKQDLATANFYGNTVSVLRNISNQGSINFETRKEFGVGQTPTSIAAGDFDNDGKFDLTVTNSKSSNVSVLRNTSNGIGIIRFDARIEYALPDGSSPFSIAVGDFNRDGKQDLVTANNSSNNISVLRNVGNIAGINKFSPSIDFTVGTNSAPYWVAVQDFDGDGKQDVVTANSNSNNISILRNISNAQGLINFASPVNFAVGSNPRFVAVGDFDKDGKLDIAVINKNSDNVSILKNTSSFGTISFANEVILSVNSSPSSLVISDFNADGKPDIAVTNTIGTTVSLFRNLSAGNGIISFTQKIDFGVNSNPLFITSDDFDGDGKPDLAVTNHIEPNGIISILRNISTNEEEINFAPKIDFAITSNPEFNIIPGQIVTGDINNDSKADIIVINSALQKVSVLKNSSNTAGTINFEPRIDTDTSVTTSSLAIGDFNQDGKQDISFSSYNSNNVGILQNPCTTTLGSQFDFDGDGRSDISVFRPLNGTWYLQQSTAGFTGVAFGASDDVITPADFDGDGKTDIAVFRPSNGTWYLQQSSAGFTGFTFGANGDIPMPADYDGDGKADIAVFRPSNGTWYIQGTLSGFVGLAFGANGDIPVAADYDGDGKADIAVFRPSNGTWYLQQSTAGFTGIAFGATEDKPVAADYDGDGKSDIAVFRPSNGTWYLQQSTAGFSGIAFGASDDLPTPADYDGDGKSDIAVFRPSNGTWYLNRSTQGFTGIAFGATGDKPAPNAFIR